MEMLKFEYEGRTFRVYLFPDAAVFVDVKDLYYASQLCQDEKIVKEILSDHPAAKTIGKRPLWHESVFYHVWMDDMAADKFMFFYLEEVQPRIRETLMCMAEKSRSESDKVRQLEEDLEMNLSERRKAEKSLSEYGKQYDLLLKHFVRVCTEKGALERQILELVEAGKVK